MQLRACLGVALLALGACAAIPKGIHIVVDGTTLDFKRAPETAAEPEPAPADEPER
jgi:hypothetical protein